MNSEPKVRVGLLSAPSVKIEFHSPYFQQGNEKKVNGTHEFTAADLGKPLTFMPCIGTGGTFSVEDVTIGVDFHWQRREKQMFGGCLTLLPDGTGSIIVINEVEVEKYLQSVVASEMSADASLEFLKAHAVISRSWLLSQIRHQTRKLPGQCSETEEETVKWYDHEAHTLFDVCADDHCQRYQGLTRITSPTAAEAVKLTAGQVLMYNGEICDARFSKCCGGVTERFSTCWQNIDVPYLTAFTDTEPERPLPDLTGSRSFDKWVHARPDAFCNTSSRAILSKVLNSYDLEIPDFFRWKVTYSGDELASIIAARSGVDYGRIISLTPLHRGASGRIDRLEIKGTLRTRVIGKELEIRRTLSRSHLYSSAFTVEVADAGADGVPSKWTLYGAGWGHGVGLCQVGAAVMAEKGFGYNGILSHYFPGTHLEKIY